MKSLTNCYLINWFFIPSFSRAFHSIAIQQIKNNTTHTHAWIHTLVLVVAIWWIEKERELMNVLHIIVWDYLLWFIISEWKSSAWHSISSESFSSAILGINASRNNEGRNSFYKEWLVFSINLLHFFSYDVYSIYACMQMNIISLWILYASVVLVIYFFIIIQEI